MSYSFTLTTLEHWRASRAVQRRTLMYKLAWAFFGGAPIIIVTVAVAGGANAWEYMVSNPIGQHRTRLARGPSSCRNGQVHIVLR